MTSPRHWPSWLRRLTIVVVVIGALVVIARLLLDPIATRVTRHGLAGMEGMSGDFERVHVTVFGPGYTITRLKLIQDPGGDWREPIFYAEEVHLGIAWRRLLHGELVARVHIDEPKVTIVAQPGPTTPKAKKAPDLSAQLQKVTPFKIDRIDIRRGEFLFRDPTQPGHPELWVHRLDLTARNLATREKLADDRSATIDAKGVVGRSGEMKLGVSADLFASPLAFEGRFDMIGLRVAELYAFIEPKTKLQTPRGTIDLFAEFKSKGGRLEGGVKPVLKDLDVRPAEPGAWDRFKAWLAEVGVKAASDHTERHAVATIVPIEGRLASPDLQLWPAILGVVRNAFVEGIAGGFEHLPPPVAPKKEGAIAQAKDALTKGKGPPKAQPVKPKDAGAKDARTKDEGPPKAAPFKAKSGQK
jgi:hypothetical protein